VDGVGGVTAVDGCSLTVASGSLTGLIGPNGAGKTTMFNTIAGTFRPDGGQVLRIPVDDIRIAGRKTQGVVLFRVADGESVVAASRLGDEADETEGGDKPAGM
jgi:ABC-type branched-subunit amino acid transport system ATPase component